MMYCPNCGSEIPEGSRFCQGCGAPIAESVQQAQAPNYEPQPTPYQQTQTVGYEPQPTPYQQTAGYEPQPTPYQQTAGYAPQPTPPQKKSKLKLWIILGASATVVIAAVLVFFLAIFPELTARHVNMGDYAKIDFTSKNYVNGYIKGTLRLDVEKAYDEIVTDKTKISGYEFSSYFDKTFRYEFKKKKQSDTVTERIGYKSKYLNIGDLEKRIGVRFDEDAVANVKIADEIAKNEITVEEPIKLNLFEILNQCYYTKGLSEKGVSVCMETKEVKKDGFTFRVIGFDGYYGSSSGTVYIEKDKTNRGVIEFKANKVKGNSGAKCTIALTFNSDEDDKNLVSGSPFIMTKTEREYTIKPQKGLSVSDAKSCIGKYRKVARDIYASGVYSTNVNASYLLTARDKKNSTVNMVIVLITKKSISYSKSKYYSACIFNNCYIDTHAAKSSEKYKYASIDSKTDFKSMSNLWNSLKRKYGYKYSIKKIG